MKYREYRARIEFDEDDNIFVGRVIGLLDIIGFHADSVAKLERAFHEAVDDYLDHCEKTGKKPQREFSGKFNLRLSPEQHKLLVFNAERAKKSLNDFVIEKLFSGKDSASGHRDDRQQRRRG